MCDEKERGENHSYVFINEGEKDRVPTFITLQSTWQNIVIIGDSVCLIERHLMTGKDF